MTKVYKSFGFEVAEVKEDDGSSGPVGIIEGYASTFGNVDVVGDIIEAGAFAKTIKEKKGIWPLLLDHNPSKHVGWNIEATEDDKGLKTRSEILLVTEEAKNRYELAKRAHKLKTKMGLSIGFNIVKAKPDKENPGIRRIQEVRMWEHSIVAFPANPKASTTAIKGMDDEQTEKVLELLKKAGYSLKQINEALGLVGVDHSEPPAADLESCDPEILQSLAALTAAMRS